MLLMSSCASLCGDLTPAIISPMPMPKPAAPPISAPNGPPIWNPMAAPPAVPSAVPVHVPRLFPSSPCCASIVPPASIAAAATPPTPVILPPESPVWTSLPLSSVPSAGLDGLPLHLPQFVLLKLLTIPARPFGPLPPATPPRAPPNNIASGLNPPVPPGARFNVGVPADAPDQSPPPVAQGAGV